MTGEITFVMMLVRQHVSALSGHRSGTVFALLITWSVQTGGSASVNHPLTDWAVAIDFQWLHQLTGARQCGSLKRWITPSTAPPLYLGYYQPVPTYFTHSQPSPIVPPFTTGFYLQEPVAAILRNLIIFRYMAAAYSPFLSELQPG